MLDGLPTEQALPGSAHLDRLTTGEVLALMNSADAEIAEAVRRELPRIARAVDAIAAALDPGSASGGGRLFYIGAGTSGRLGVLDASECPPTFGIPAEQVRGIMAGGEAALSRATEASEDDPTAGARDLLAAGVDRKVVARGYGA